VVEKTVQQGGGHGSITCENTGPVLEGDIGGDGDGAVLVAFGDNLEQELSTSLIEGEVSQFVNNQESRVLVTLNFASQLTAGFCGAEAVDYINSSSKQDAVAGQASGMAQGGGQMGFSDTRRPEQDHIGAAAQEVECQEMLELHAVKLGWPVPVPASHSFDHGEASVLDATLDAFVVPEGDLTGDELLKEL